MKISKFEKRIISVLLSISVLISALLISNSGVSASESEYMNKEGMELGYSTINGYSKMFYRLTNAKSGKIAVYSGLDITNPYVFAMCSVFILQNGIDFDRFITDNDYAVENVKKLDSFFKSVGIKNERAADFVRSVNSDKISFELALDTVGFYVFNASADYAYELMDNNEYVDFVLSGGKVPSNMKDLNFDGKTDKKDARLIQQYLCGMLDLKDEDECSYALFASDFNKDKSIDIIDVTDLLKNAAGIS